MSGETWIEIRNWAKYQHYPNRNPPWIKLHLNLLHDDNWRALTPARRTLLVSLWMLRASKDRSPKDENDLEATWIRLDVKLINSWLGLHAKMSDYEALNHAGFINFRASKLSARHALARDLEVDVEKSLPLPSAVVQYVPLGWQAENDTHKEEP